MFIRIYRPNEDKEILINVDMIWKIEVSYGVEDERGNFSATSLKRGIENPESRRMYRVFFGGDVSLIPGQPDDPVTKVLEQIYKDAIKN